MQKHLRPPSLIMRKQARRTKVFEPTTSKPVLAQDRRNNVTAVTLNVDDQPNLRNESEQVTRRGRNSPKRCYTRLGPWLRLANLARPYAEQEFRGAVDLQQLSDNFAAELGPANLSETPSFPGRRLQELLEYRHSPGQPIGSQTQDGGGGDKDATRSISIALYGLATAVAKVFARLVGMPESLRPGIQLSNSRASIWAQFVTLREKDGRVYVNVFDPYNEFFLLALRGSEVSRHRTCEVCGNFFYAIRLNQRACSKRCNSVRRVRNWREKQATHEQNRKFKSAGVRPEGRKS